MAYMSQEKKKAVAGELKKALAGAPIKWSLSVRHHSTLVLTIREGSIDFIGNYNETVANRRVSSSQNHQLAEKELNVNTYHFQDDFTGEALDVLKKIHICMMNGNHDRSDIMTDYFDVGWYIDIHVGRWDKPYKFNNTNGCPGGCEDCEDLNTGYCPAP